MFGAFTRVKGIYKGIYGIFSGGVSFCLRGAGCLYRQGQRANLLRELVLITYFQGRWAVGWWRLAVGGCNGFDGYGHDGYGSNDR